MNTPVQRKYFTLEEANQRLPLVRAIVADIVSHYRDLHDRRERLKRIRQSPGFVSRDEDSVYSEEVEQVERDLEKDVERLQEFVDELQSLGVEFKDPVKGLVDFPAIIDGREAYLCWQLGEDEIAFWHELDAGFSGRQSLLEKSVSGEAPSDDEAEE
jgi:hypothetical protein